MRYFLILFSVLVCVACNDSEAQPKKENVEKVDCTKDVYVKIGTHVLKLPNNDKSLNQRIYIKEPDGKSRRSNCFQSSKEQPIEAHEISFFVKIEMEGHDPVAFDIDIHQERDTDSYWLWMQEDLTERGLSIEDLPVVDGFYSYEAKTRPVYKYYKMISDMEGDYLRLMSCAVPKKAILCSARFLWLDNLKAHASAVDLFKFDSKRRRYAPLGIWHELHPAIVNKLDFYLYNNLSTQGEEGKK